MSSVDKTIKGLDTAIVGYHMNEFKKNNFGLDDSKYKLVEALIYKNIEDGNDKFSFELDGKTHVIVLGEKE